MKIVFYNNAALSLADSIFQEIRSYQNLLNCALSKRRKQFYSYADEFTNTVLSEDTVLFGKNTHCLCNHCCAEDTIDELTLQALEAHNKNDFERAQVLYTKILDKPVGFFS